MLANVVYFHTLSFAQIAASGHVASDVVRSFAGSREAAWLTVAMAISALGALHGVVLTGAPQIEPSIPYSLGVLVQNQGYGVAHDFRITSAQPKIVDNEKGLLINFQIIGAQVGTQPVAPSLTVDFGDLAPGQVQEGRWLLTSSLQGLFVDYSATFQHVDSLGNPRLSLIEGVEIHEMIHLVQAPGAWDDGLPDFLVDDLPDRKSTRLNSSHLGTSY